MKLPFLGEIPLVQSIREGGDSGLPVALDENTPAAIAFNEAADNLIRNIAIRNATKPLSHRTVAAVF